MKKLTYLVIATITLGMAACTGGNKAGYVVTGTVEGAADGDTVYLIEPNRSSLIKLDTAFIDKGTFTFEGTQDSVAYRLISCKANGKELAMDFFLENGKINIALTKDNDSATGTANNDVYQPVRAQMHNIGNKMEDIYTAMGDSTLTDEQKAAKQKEADQLDEEYEKMMKEAVQKNITNPVGIYLFKQMFYSNSTDENDALLQQIPANFQNDETIVRIKEMTEKQKKTAVGTKFIDFEMPTPEGKAMKLSDYAGKGKVVLIDFWASWCGPCRADMPELVKTYAQYKGKNFEIIGVSLDYSDGAWKSAIKQLAMTWPQMSDLKHWQSEGAQLYAVNSIPHTVLIDGEGTIIARGLRGDKLKAAIEEAVK